MTASTAFCVDARGGDKETFSSVHAARKALGLKRRFKSRRFPHVYRCPCGGYHLTGATR